MNQNTLLEQYKLYTELADRVSDRRMRVSQFYITLLSSYLLLLSFVFGNNSAFVGYQALILFCVGLLGSFTCIVWWVNIHSYRQLNRHKFKVIHELEEGLTFPCFKREWELSGNGGENRKYLKLTSVEKYIPCLLITPFLILICIGLVLLFIPDLL